MSNARLLKRLDSIQKELERIRSQITPNSAGNSWRKMAGAFSNDPLFEKAVRLGRSYRESLRPGQSRKKRP